MQETEKLLTHTLHNLSPSLRLRRQPLKKKCMREQGEAGGQTSLAIITVGKRGPFSHFAPTTLLATRAQQYVLLFVPQARPGRVLHACFNYTHSLIHSSCNISPSLPPPSYPLLHLYASESPNPNKPFTFSPPKQRPNGTFMTKAGRDSSGIMNEKGPKRKKRSNASPKHQQILEKLKSKHQDRA
ncbi:uncharacterized protein EI97DRAFT_255305 [Westerdykella ornata]|uniref:Uncharacterized protein n=1 Tax=Westerdykella ornata TaxID=318751 RepID=A0A6A6JTW6_WESOR|nr:uncharacterized protein EI97DRAFT_255305 [Westerdykella ornata]KAF2278459.1 hypothetical protein EI97DRAFT_255305 [Westerdykella ornata]